MMDRQALIAILTGNASEKQLDDIRQWRAARPENEEEYQRLVRIWEMTGQLDRTEWDVAPPTAREITEIAEMRAKQPASVVRRELSSKRRPPAKSGWLRWGAAIAASLVLGLGIGFLSARVKTSAPLAPDELVTGTNEVATVALRDGTVVRLAPESRLRFSRAGEAREVFLDGRGYFAVAEDDGNPFHVRLPGGDVEVLGTRFDVESRGGELQVVVVEGKVKMGTTDRSVTVVARQMGRASETEGPVVQPVDDVYKVINWLGRFLAFESTPLPQVVEEFQERFGMRVEVADSTLRARSVTGWFADQSPEQMLAGICRAVDAQCTLHDGLVRMKLSQRGRTPGSAVAASDP